MNELSDDFNIEITETQLSGFNKCFDKICRACLSDTDITPFAKITFGNMSCYQIFESFTTLKVLKDDNLPQNICLSCINELIRMCTFKQKCLQADSKLKDILNGPKSNCRKYEENKTDKDCNITKSKTSKVLRRRTRRVRRKYVYEKTDYINNEDNSNSGDKNYMENESHEDFSGILEKSQATSKDDVQVLTCKTCKLTFQTSDDLKKHRQEVRHPRPRNHMCEICFKSFSYSHLKQHMRTHTKEKPFQCSVCQLRFSLNCNLRRHMMTHTGERPHICDVCGKGFIQATTLVEHKRIHTGETPFVCSYCGKGFTQSARHKAHLRKHLIENGETDKFVSDTECNICHRIFASKGVLKTHLLTHGEKTFLCSDCGKGFVSNAGLRSHLKVHTGVRPYSCNMCEKSFSQLGSLKSHMLIHTGDKPFICHVCSKAFTQRNHLKYHLRVHSGERPYKCTYCGKCFALNGTLTVHIRTHTGETPYVCDVCGKGFYDSSSMKKHRKAHGDNAATINSTHQTFTNLDIKNEVQTSIHL